ncbi:TraV family lipoprotein (plasmid) [Legionella geestiana]|uniref:TraV family lipoprotein n=1 Tax=Legionella geestiana TaxID=45065 RepID=UPI001091902A|nr:TraV family lipoprotein [Legionella geestiana]QDQ41172.1 TraV family lipoprotein [Legionella geestiana]
MKAPLFIAVLAGLLTGCGTMNSNFSCNATAGDSCLTIEQVDAMTRFADDVKSSVPVRGMMKADNTRKGTPGRIVQTRNGKAFWLATEQGGSAWG